MIRPYFPWLLLISALCGGCETAQRENIAIYQWNNLDSAVRDLRQRADAIQTVSTECTITLTRADGDSAAFDGAMVMQNPDRVRLRAWKFNRAVFDLTLTPEGLWVMTPDHPGHKEQIVPATASAADFIKQWAWLNGGMFRSADLQAREHGDSLVLTSRGMSCEVDRKTLTPRRYVTTDGFELRLERYREINQLPWPTRLIARNPSAGTVIVQQRNIEINGELAPNAFVPPRRAEKRP